MTRRALAVWFGHSEVGAWHDFRNRGKSQSRKDGTTHSLEADVFFFVLWLPYDFVGFLFGRDGIVWWFILYGSASIGAIFSAAGVLAFLACCFCILGGRRRR